MPLEEITTGTEWTWYEKERDEDDEDESFVIKVDLGYPKDELIRAFKKMLDERHQGERGRPEHESWNLTWPLKGRPNVDAIKLALAVYEKKKQLEKAEKPSSSWAIALALKAQDPPVQLNKEWCGDADNEYRHRDEEDWKLIIAAQVSRYLKHARRLIAGVERGVFPSNDPADDHKKRPRGALWSVVFDPLVIEGQVLQPVRIK